jgi:hypothetical protein
MASIFPSSCFRSKDDLRKLRKLIRWQAPRFDRKMRHEIMPLTSMGLVTPSTSPRTPGLGSCSHSLFSSSCYWSTTVFSFTTCHRTPSHWWQSSSTSVRCTCACGRRCVCFAASTCCALPGGAQPPSVATPSSTEPRVHQSTSPPLGPASGTAGGRTG